MDSVSDHKHDLSQHMHSLFTFHCCPGSCALERYLEQPLCFDFSAAKKHPLDDINEYLRICDIQCECKALFNSPGLKILLFFRYTFKNDNRYINSNIDILIAMHFTRPVL